MQPSDPITCPSCHSPIPADAPGGLCPGCALEAAASVPATGTGDRHAPPPSLEEIAPHFQELEILELLGAGGMGAVYKARQPQLDRFVALKILSHDLANDPSFVERFNREAKVLARLSHPNIVAVFDFGTAGPFCYLLMEYVDGVNLRQAMRTGGFQPTDALALVRDVCSALQFAHEEGILHRDIKPENILIDSKGRVKIADFGIAKLIGVGAASDVTLTLQGSILGSPHYMAPEQIETPGDIDQRADIYSLGVVLYEMLTGELPIGRFDLPSEKAAMDQRIDEIVLRTLAKERQQRYQSAGEVGTQVAAVAGSAPPPPAAVATVGSGDSGSARFSLLAAILTGASLILLFVFFWLWNTNAPQPASPADEAESILWKLIPGLLTLGVGLISALVGFFLGARALGEIRKSGGTKDGLGFTVFAVVTWPILIMGVMFMNCMPLPMPGTGGVVTPIATLLAGVPMLLACFFLIRGLRHWARGVVKKDGKRHFPGLTGPLLTTLGLAVLGLVLVVVLPPLLGRFLGVDEDGLAEIDRRMGVEDVSPKVAIVSSRNEVDWHRGAPEALVPIKIHDSYRAEFRLALYDGEGNFQKGAEIGSWTPFLKRRNLRIEDIETCLVKVGTTPSEDQEGHRGVTAIVESNGARGTLVADTDFAEWDFDCDELNLDVPHLPLTSAGSYAHTLAKRDEKIDGKTKRTGTLRLDVQLIER